ncbi:I78 family peptidase inhibitor [Primorskyibacter aestuariivivens]|uniref:I78 family peptidase inhibitor n=1 Tax=Primorskyibacter aestuariivivens TaxID=1888912 RepID=UPI0023012F6A|nr:I78 family peptidase inhibitor [Primorskyibacter aestuariivivens]MDA7429371.1 I78 family peptidase inhibitor [Primorskyibacter aestuariivivens]
MFLPVRLAVAALVSAPLGACLPAQQGNGPASYASPGSAAPLCTPGIWSHLKGKPREAADAVPAPMRVIGPDDVMTMDHNPSRTNIAVDHGGTIVRVFCG